MSDGPKKTEEFSKRDFFDRQSGPGRAIAEALVNNLNKQALAEKAERENNPPPPPEPSSSERFHQRASRMFKRRDSASATREMPPRFDTASQSFKDALLLAADLHASQTRKGTDIPYLAHLLGTASIAIEFGAGEDEAIAALLHDAAEDCGGMKTLEEIRARFGDAVADIVEGCSDTFEDPKPDWKTRKPAYIARIPRESESVRLVSASDKLHNARSILMDYRKSGEVVFDRFKDKTKYHTLWYYRRLADWFLKTDADSQLFWELDRVVAELEQKVDDDDPDGFTRKGKTYAEMDGWLEDLERPLLSVSGKITIENETKRAEESNN